MSCVTRFQILRGTTVQRLAFTPKIGELVQDTDTKVLYIGDGVTAGGVLAAPLAAQAQDLVLEARNATGSTIPKFSVVYISGATGNKPTIALSQANSEAASSKTIGVTQDDVLNNTNSFILVQGKLINVDTSAFTEGQALWLSPSVAGGVTTTKPVAPNHMVFVGIVTRSHATLGEVEINIQNGFELDELHDVLITSKTDGQVLAYESASGLWKNKSLTTSQITDFNTTIGTSTQTALNNKYDASNPSSFQTAMEVSIIADSLVTAHEASGDPHPQYATDSDLSSGLALKADASSLGALAFLNTVTSTQIDDNAVTNTKIANNSVTVGKLGNSAVQNSKMAQMPTLTIKGNDTGSTTNPKDLTVAETKTMLAIDQVDNTSDANKPISTATQTALNNKYDASNPSGYQTAAQVSASIAAVVNSAPAALDTLSELAAALGNDSNFATTTATALGNRLRVDTDAQGLTGTQKTNAKTNLDLQNIDNTSDLNKPISTATQTALNNKYDASNPSGYQTSAQVDTAINTKVNGTANCIAKFNTANSVGDSVLNEISGKIGLNVASPETALHTDGAHTLGSGTTPYRRVNNVLQFNKASAAVTSPGALVITTPVAGLNTMSRIDIHGFDYNANNGAWSLNLFGYATTSNNWTTQMCVVNGRPSFKRVRFAFDTVNSKMAIILGEIDTSWHYTRFAVDVLSAHSSGYISMASGAWTAQILTDLTNYTMFEATVLGLEYNGANARYDAGDFAIGGETYAGKLTVEGVVALKDSTTPSDTATYGKAYSKSDGNLYYKYNGVAETKLNNQLPTSAANGQVLTYTSGNWQAANPPSGGLSPLSFNDYWVETKLYTSATLVIPFAGAAISTGTITTAIPVAALNGYNPYGAFVRSSTTANSGYRWQTSSVITDYFGVHSKAFLASMLFRTAFTNNTVRFGYLDNTTVTDAVDGAYFEVNSTGNVSAKTASNSTRTTTSLGALSLNEVYHFVIKANAAGTQIDFEVYQGTSSTPLYTTSITTNIPNTTTRVFGAGWIGTNSGTVASDIAIVYMLGYGTIAGLARARGI